MMMIISARGIMPIHQYALNALEPCNSGAIKSSLLRVRVYTPFGYMSLCSVAITDTFGHFSLKGYAKH